MARKYEKVQELLPAIKEMLKEGYTQREVAESFGLSDKEVVKKLLHRDRERQARIAAGIQMRPQGRPRKDAVPRDVVAEQAYEIRRLKMENELLRDFLSLTGKE
ncbi:MAG: imidazolonepropionase [Clostridiales bacterium]|nr:imidazolonepropionase [Candidatus Apopatocola equi]